MSRLRTFATGSHAARLARSALASAAALDAWQSGRMADLSTRTPPIRFDDPDQAEGLKLIAYRIFPPPEGLNPPAIGVMPSLRDQKGRAIQRPAEYRVEVFDQIGVRSEES
jgi:hypothetical protein